MKPIINFFKAIGDFLNRAEDYVDYRVRTGKFVGDIKELLQRLREAAIKKITTTSIAIYKSPLFQKFLAAFRKQWAKLLKIPLFANSVSLVSAFGWVLIKFYGEIFIVFALTFPSVVLLLNFFQNSVQTFFIAFFPILFYNTYCLAALYYCISQREKGEKISLWNSFAALFKRVPSLSFITFTQVGVLLIVTLTFSILSLFFSYFFEAMGLVWSNSFFYWFFVIFFGSLIALCLFVVTIVMHQAFFVVLLEQKKFQQGIRTAWKLLQAYPLQYLFFYLLLYIYFGVIMYWAMLYYLYLGIAVSIFFFIQASLFLGFLLHKHLQIKIVQEEITEVRTSPLLVIIAIFGILNYALIAVVFSKNYSYITSGIEEQRKNYLLSQQLQTYINTVYRYSIEYPQTWSTYENRGSSVTFYTNYTGTVTGGIWLNITVSPFSEKEFNRLYLARPGLVNLDTQTRDVTTKVSNLSVQGYEGVSYTYVKSEQPYAQYQTHYLIHKDEYVYDIMFTTLDKEIEDNNNALFEKVINSFRFIK